MTEQEKIKRLAEWMGWHIEKWANRAWLCSSAGKITELSHWNPFTSLDHVSMLIREAQKRGWHYEIGDNHVKDYYCLLYKEGRIRDDVWGFGQDDAHAICDAVLRLME